MYINDSVTCPLSSCPKSGDCIRFTNYRQMSAESEVYSVLNEKFLKPNDEGCQYLLLEKTERIAYGFTRLTGTIPVANAGDFFCRIPFLGSRASYYRARSGNRALTPEEQQVILDAVEAAGGNISVGFDRYAEEAVLIKK